MPSDERTFIKLHDGMPDHPKIDGLSDKAFRLLVETWCWCSRHLTDGHVPAGTWNKRGNRSSRRELEDAGLVEPQASDVVMHDYLAHQRSAEEVADLREKKKLASAKGNHDRWHVGATGKPSATCPHCPRDEDVPADEPPPDLHEEARAAPDSSSQSGSQVASQVGSRQGSQTGSDSLPHLSPETDTDTDKDLKTSAPPELALVPRADVAVAGTAEVVPAPPSTLVGRAQAIAKTYYDLHGKMTNWNSVQALAKTAIQSGWSDEAVCAALARLHYDKRTPSKGTLERELQGPPKSNSKPTPSERARRTLALMRPEDERGTAS